MRPSTGRTEATIKIRVSEGELSLIKELAKDYKSVSEYIRLKALCNHRDCPVIGIEERKKIAFETVQKQLNRNNSNVA
jgi:hypothetical protein